MGPTAWSSPTLRPMPVRDVRWSPSTSAEEVSALEPGPPILVLPLSRSTLPILAAALGVGPFLLATVLSPPLTAACVVIGMVGAVAPWGAETLSLRLGRLLSPAFDGRHAGARQDVLT